MKQTSKFEAFMKGDVYFIKGMKNVKWKNLDTGIKGWIVLPVT